LLIVILGLAAYVYLGRDGNGPRPGEKTAEILGPAVSVPPGEQAPDAGRTPAAADVCKESREKLQGLFAYLDRQEYVASQQLAGGAGEHFKALLVRLLERPPFAQRETDDLVQVLQNKAHFYRVLGKKNTLLLRDIIRKEGDMMESSFAILYQAMAVQEKCTADGPALRAPLKEVYPYAVFFLNTLGGSSYLIRRDSRVRMLTQYYSILILDQANQRRLNKLGLDIRPPLEALIGDLKGTANLTRKEEYIETLKSIRARY
ncbi:MAG: hypothetical protein IH628_17320, partial [Proteobacteria bacterium]|nr:hypothetical protein [Pseudomonadota bacterium]